MFWVAPWPLLKSRSIYLALRKRILSNDIEPGTHLVMRDVAESVTRQRHPRPAKRCTCSSGTAGSRTTPTGGARLAELTAKEVEETYFVRSHLESVATGLAAERVADAEGDRLDELMSGGPGGGRPTVTARRSPT